MMSDDTSINTPPISQDMPNDPTMMDASTWSTTYGVLTADRALRSLNVTLENNELQDAIKNSKNAYFQLLRVPMQNIFNGIILQQATDYQIYVQKLYVDYLLSGEGNKDEDSPGADAREQLEKNRLTLVATGETFAAIEMEHKKLIAESQIFLKEKAKLLNPTIPYELPNEIKPGIEDYAHKTLRIKAELCDYRSQFYALILEVTDLLKTLPDFHVDEAKVEENREPLHFDPNIGMDAKS